MTQTMYTVVTSCSGLYEQRRNLGQTHLCVRWLILKYDCLLTCFHTAQGTVCERIYISNVCDLTGMGLTIAVMMFDLSACLDLFGGVKECVGGNEVHPVSVSEVNVALWRQLVVMVAIETSLWKNLH